jgi:ankyrin repeat protein
MTGEKMRIYRRAAHPRGSKVGIVGLILLFALMLQSCGKDPNAVDNRGYTALSQAVLEWKDAPALRALLDSGSDYHSGENGKSALEVAMQIGNA